MLYSYNDLLTDVLDRAEEETGSGDIVSEFYSLASGFLDRVYLDLLNMRPWMWARSPRPHLVRVYGPIPVTVNWPSGSYIAEVTLTQPPRLPDLVSNWKLLIGNQPYRILGEVPSSLPPAPMVLTMEAPWSADSLVNFAATAYRDEYDLVEVPEAPQPPVLAIDGTGDIPPGLYFYSLTYLGGIGETPRGQISFIRLLEPSRVNITLPKHPQGNPFAIGWGVYRGDVDLLFLLDRKYPELGTLNDIQITDNVPGPLTASQPALPNDPNGTIRVRHIYGVRPKGVSQRREIDPMSEMEVRDRYGWEPRARWPPLAYSRISQNRILLSHYPTQDDILEVYHTVIGKPLSLCSPSEILVPPQWRHALADGALALLLEQKHLDRASVWAASMKVHVVEMEADDEKVKKGYDSNRRGQRHEAGR